MRLTLFIPVMLLCSVCHAQQQGYSAFTINDGLPSNYIYRSIEDDKGFLWVATDAGIARFDGRHFQVFTTADGLPDNEVLNVVKENDGRIWVNCFKQSPCYFDEQQNRFINASTDTSLAKARQSTGMTQLLSLQNGGVMYYSEQGSYVFRNKKIAEKSIVPDDAMFLISAFKPGYQLRYKYTHISTGLFKAELAVARGDSIISTFFLRHCQYDDIPLPAVNDSKFYLFLPYKKKFFAFSNIVTSPLRCKMDSVILPETFFSFGFTGNWINVYCNSGKIYVYDKNTLQLQFILSGAYIPNSMYKDATGNLWVSTIDKGLLLYKKNQFGHVPMPPGFNNSSFLSIACNKQGIIYAGNYNGEVLEFRNGVVTTHASPQKNISIFRQRKILFSGEKIFTFSENGIYVNFKKQVTSPNSHLFGKTAINYNDSTIIIGLSTSIRRMNTIAEKTAIVQAPKKRVTAMVKTADGFVYYGSTDGLYKYDFAKDTGWPLTNKSPLFTERVTGLCTTPDGLLWIATASNGIVVAQHDKALLHIAGSGGIMGNAARCIATGRPGQVWVGTWSGLSVINYALKNNAITYSIQQISVKDGLANNIINETVYYNDTVYAATGDGISVVPAGAVIPGFDIPVQLTHISINQRDTAILPHYNLSYQQRDIQMRLAGIELGGHFNHFQYTIDNNARWVTLEENILAVQLSNGNHTVQVRAVDVNGRISNKILTIHFSIATPFWKALWFWVMVVIALQAVTSFILFGWLKKKKEAKLARQMTIVQTAALEQRAFTSLLNPHFMFNALNSIQHYINLQDRKNANRYLSDFASLIRKNFEASQKSFIGLDEELENIKIYLRLEQLRFSDRFAYEINIADNIDADDWMVPTMMLQPFLENALLHGIMPLTVKGVINISISGSEQQLLLTITDNGIGIASSRALKTGAAHNSYGMELIEKRVKALRLVSEDAISIHICNATTDEANPGTKITLLIQKGLYHAWLHTQKL